jgi:uncharacterized protein (UPF0332 family)
MKEKALAFWERALKSLEVAEIGVEKYPDASASRAYYSAFYAVSALFALRGRSFSKHSAIESAVHAELIKTKEWPPELGEAFSFLRGLRQKGDYGVADHVSVGNAQKALEEARRILEAVHQTHPDLFPFPSEKP